MPLLYSSRWPDLLILPSWSFPPFELAQPRWVHRHPVCPGRSFHSGNLNSLLHALQWVLAPSCLSYFISCPLSLDSQPAFSPSLNIPNTFPPRALAFTVPSLWNSSPPSLHNVQSLTSFKYFSQLTVPWLLYLLLFYKFHSSFTSWDYAIYFYRLSLPTRV